MFARLLLLAACLLPFEARAQLVFADGFEASRPGLGINLEGVEDYAAAYPFVDFFKQTRPWFTAAPWGCPLDDVQTDAPSCFNTLEAAELDLDADGWVQSLPPCTPEPPSFCHARTVINSAGADYPAGDYLVLYEGSGTLSYGGATRNDALSRPGREVVTVGPHAFWYLTIEATAPAPDNVRNIRILPPGFDPDLAPLPRFHPDFLARLRGFRTLRFMDWMRTNGGGFGGWPNPEIEPGDRAQLSTAQWTGAAGVPIEVMVELANELGAEPWFTIPHQASDALVREFATVIRDRLTPGRRLYVEHSNEVWNAFPQGADVEATAQQQFPDSAESGFTKRLNRHGLRTAQICALFREVFAGEAERVVCVLGAQAANPFTAEQAAGCPLAVAAGLVTDRCLQPGDAVAIAPYFGGYLDGPANADEVQLWSLDTLFAELESGGQLLDDNGNGSDGSALDDDDVATPCTGYPPAGHVPPCTMSALDQTLGWTQTFRQSADARGLRLLAYEGGQHLVGAFGVENIQPINDLFVAGNRDPRMGAAYTRYLKAWKDAGGELFVLYNSTYNAGRFGSWGLLESLTETPDPPKYTAVRQFMTDTPCWWQGCGR